MSVYSDACFKDLAVQFDAYLQILWNNITPAYSLRIGETHSQYGIPGGTLRGEGKTARGDQRGATSEGKTARGKLRGATCEGRPARARARSEERAGMQRGVPLLPLMRFGRNIRLARFCLVLVTRAAVSSS